MKPFEQKRAMLARLSALGVTATDAAALIRISNTLSMWGEEECNGTIQRDEHTDLPRKFMQTNKGEAIELGIIPDREAKALKQMKAIAARYPLLWFYHQGDPRGAQVYVGSRAELGQRRVDSCYSTFGVAVYKP